MGVDGEADGKPDTITQGDQGIILVAVIDDVTGIDRGLPLVMVDKGLQAAPGPVMRLALLVQTEMTRCIHCTRCVRFGQEIAGIMELGATGRGENMRIGTYVEHAVNSEMSGNVIDLCPVGALTSKPYRYTGRPWENIHKPSIAPHDCIGSNIELDVRRNQVMRVVPRENEALNEMWLSDRDRFSYSGIYSEQRALRPQIKQGDEWKEVEWETALAYALEGLKTVRNQKGAEQLGALASPSASLEEHYLLQKLMRGVGSNNIDHRLRQQDFSDQDIAPLYPALGQGIAGHVAKTGEPLLIPDT